MHKATYIIIVKEYLLQILSLDMHECYHRKFNLGLQFSTVDYTALHVKESTVTVNTWDHDLAYLSSSPEANKVQLYSCNVPCMHAWC